MYFKMVAYVVVIVIKEKNFVDNIGHYQSVNALAVLEVCTELALDGWGELGCSKAWATL